MHIPIPNNAVGEIASTTTGFMSDLNSVTVWILGILLAVFVIEVIISFTTSAGDGVGGFFRKKETPLLDIEEKAVGDFENKWKLFEEYQKFPQYRKELIGRLYPKTAHDFGIFEKSLIAGAYAGKEADEVEMVRLLRELSKKHPA